jgi:orotate phosphoribosyltransferase
MYCDNRQTLGHPEVRALIARAFESLLSKASLRPEAIIGVATGAIPHAAVLAERLELPMGYVRASAKGHGKRNQIEGFSVEGSRVVVVEDLISTGGSSIAAVNVATQSGMNVEAVVAIFTYGFPLAGEAFAKEAIPLESIVDLNDLVAAAREAGRLDESEDATLQEWRIDPVGWSERHEEAQ